MIKCRDGINHIDEGINSNPKKVLNQLNDIYYKFLLRDQILKIN